MQSKTFQIGILSGALLLAGLFYFRTKHEEAPIEARLKPSQMDFSKSNQLPGPTTSTTLADSKTTKIELKKTGELSEADQKKWTVFEEILNSKNDNDPRVDQELRHLSPEMHQNLRAAYSGLPAENRNGRGFIAFLVARDLKDVQDVQFIKEIFQESPCLSFQSCGQAGAPDPHFDGINETSLNYPQLASLYQIQKQLESNPGILNSSEMKNSIKDTLREARQFPSSAVQNRAREIQEKFGL